VRVGKVPNPFVWKVGKDNMLWDNDINPEGASLSLGAKPSDALSLFAHVAHFVIDENTSAKDPHLWGFQVGAHHALSDHVRWGARGTLYDLSSLDADFVGRGVDGTGGATDSAGNIEDGLTGDDEGDGLRVGELAAYLTWAGCESWPVTLYGTWARNLDAEDSTLFPEADEEDQAWGLGLELGDKKRYAMLGAGYWHIEANSFPSQFIDSDLFDGRTNREGFAFYGSRAILANTDLNLTLFLSDEIEGDSPAFDESVESAERVRLQADLVFKF
jgi:hypothetical protein